jgi:NTE family protein
VHIKEGKAVDAIRASIAIPGIITPLKLKNRYLIDGGVTNPLPVNVVRKMGADIIIAVDLNHSFLKERRYSRRSYQKNALVKWFTPDRPNIIDVIESSIFVMQNQLTQKNLMVHKPDFLIQPNLGTTGIFDFHEAKRIIREGYDQTIKIIPKIRRLI